MNPSDIKWNTIPTKTIKLSDLSRPSEIMNLMSGVSRYVYRINYKGLVLKYGMSAPQAYSMEWGERVYRQVAHARSWGKLRINGSSGSDWLEIEHDFKKLYKKKIHHKHLVVHIWDLTNYEFVTIDPRTEIEYIESYLILQYANLVGEKPIGNIHDEDNNLYKPSINRTVMDTLFSTQDAV